MNQFEVYIYIYLFFRAKFEFHSNNISFLFLFSYKQSHTIVGKVFKIKVQFHLKNLTIDFNGY